MSHLRSLKNQGVNLVGITVSRGRHATLVSPPWSFSVRVTEVVDDNSVKAEVTHTDYRESVLEREFPKRGETITISIDDNRYHI